MAATTRPHTDSARDARVFHVALAIAVAVSIGLRILIGQRFQAPTILTDELTYTSLARLIANGDISLSTGYGIVYPLLLSPAWVLFDAGTTAFEAMKAVNAILVSLTAVPVYLWTLRLARPALALAAAGLTLLLPSLAYAGTIMTENAFLPAFTLACFALALMIERPSLRRQALFLLALALLVLTRTQGIVVIAAAPLAIVLAAAAEEQRSSGTLRLGGWLRRLLPYWPLAALAGIAVGAIAVRAAATAWDPRSLLQAYAAVTTGQYDALSVARWSLWHLGDASLALGVIPVAALLALLGLLLIGRSRTTAERAFTATAAIVSPLVIIQVAVFTSWFSQRVSERNMLCVFPLFVIAVAVWLDRGAPRPRRIGAVAAAVAAGAVFTLPLGMLLQRAPSTETWGLVPLEFLSRKAPGGLDDVVVLLVAGVAIALALFGIVRSRYLAVVIVAALAVYFVGAQVVVVHTVSKAAAAYRAAPGVGEDADWIDRTVPDGADVTFLSGSTLGPDTDRLVLWQWGFFNRQHVSTLRWNADVTIDPATGLLGTPDGAPLSLSRYVITPASLQLAGATIADRGAFLLQEPSKPYRLQRSTAGVFADGWTAPTAAIDIFDGDASADAVRLTLSRTVEGSTVPPSAVTIRTGPLERLDDGTVGIRTVTDTVRIDAVDGADATADVAVPAAPFRVEIATEVPFTPVDLGLGDPRQLGVRGTATYGGEMILR